MKYLKYYEDINFNIDDWDEEEFENNDIKNIPEYTTEFYPKDTLRINNIYMKSLNYGHMLRQAKTMANRITHIDKAIRRGNAALYSTILDKRSKKEISDIFFNRAKKLYYEN